MLLFHVKYIGWDTKVETKIFQVHKCFVESIPRLAESGAGRFDLSKIPAEVKMASFGKKTEQNK